MSESDNPHITPQGVPPLRARMHLGGRTESPLSRVATADAARGSPDPTRTIGKVRRERTSAPALASSRCHCGERAKAPLYRPASRAATDRCGRSPAARHIVSCTRPPRTRRPRARVWDLETTLQPTTLDRIKHTRIPTEKHPKVRFAPDGPLEVVAETRTLGPTT